MNDGPLPLPPAVAADTSPDDPLPGARRLRHRVHNGDLRADQPDPAEAGPGHDEHPERIDEAFDGTPVADADVDSLPVEEDEP
jgi:hypothetical protein